MVSPQQALLRRQLLQGLINCPPPYPYTGPAFDEKGNPTVNGAATYVCNQMRDKELAMGDDVIDRVKNLELTVLQKLHTALTKIFFSGMINQRRITVVRYFLQHPSTEWETLAKQIKFLLSGDDTSDGHDTMWITESLTQFHNSKDRENLLLAAHKLYDWKMTSLEKAKLLSNLALKKA